MKKNIIGIIIILIVIIGGFWYLQKNQKKTISVKENPESETIKIGAILPLTGGSSSSAGVQIKKGIELYKEEFNNNNNNKAKIDIVYGDSRNSASHGISSYRDMKAQGVEYFLASNSGVVVPLLHELKRDGDNLMMTTVNSAAGVPEAGENIFRVFVSIQNETKTMAKYIKEDLKLDNISILYINDEFGKSGLEAFEKNNEVEILFKEAFNKSDSDFKNIINKLPKESEAVYVIGYDNALGLIVRQLRELGFKNKILTTIGMSVAPWRAKAGKAADGVIFTGTNFNQNSKRTDVVKFVNEFKEEFKEENVTSFNVFAYYSFKIFVDAIDSCRNNDNRCIIDKINNSKNQSIMGEIFIDKKGEADLPLSIYQYKQGQEKKIK